MKDNARNSEGVIKEGGGWVERERKIIGGGGGRRIDKEEERGNGNWRKSGERGLGGVGGCSQSDIANHPTWLCVDGAQVGCYSGSDY